jgi:hypothetical protein
MPGLDRYLLLFASKMMYPTIFLTANFSPRFDTTPTQLLFCDRACFATACFAAAVLGRFCLAGAGCVSAAPTPFKNNSTAMMLRLMLIPSQLMCAEILQKRLKPQIRFYRLGRFGLHNWPELLQIGTVTIVADGAISRSLLALTMGLSG